ncbi:MAG: hypothetical protein EYC69_13985 [Bacteroidetes bacterium]|nr:MAG: hypothetical protein EYC69_13985 [Bacteroidota bacterium]
MRTSIFQYPFETVFRRTRGALSRLGMRIISFNENDGSICAESYFSFGKQAMKVDLIVEEMENHNTKVTIRGLVHKKLFFQKSQNAEVKEINLLDAISCSL